MGNVDWISRWIEGRIGFHEGRPNAHLVTHFSALSVPKGGRVFVPLCGKTVDIHWLLGGGYRVAGAELSELAIGQLFAELGVVPEVTELGGMKRYSADGIDIFGGDIFDLDAALLGPVDAVYDRAALVALPEEARGRYVDHLTGLAGNAPQLLVSFEYDQNLMAGPPFSVSADEVRQRYGTAYSVAALVDMDAVNLPDMAAREYVWLLVPHPPT